MKRAYIDIETTGLSVRSACITVIGIGLEHEDGMEIRQLVDNTITPENILDVLRDVERVYTYNGRRFDFRFIRTHLGVDIEKICTHTDLMLECWRRRLMGGLKAVEIFLGIERTLPGADGLDAVKWWHQYHSHGNLDALELLLRYNAEDVKNLETLRRLLEVF